MTESPVPALHADVQLFAEAVNFTAARTGFNPRLIEKDYFCTLLLAQLFRCVSDRLVFKGGTCLAKVHAGFYRLSEDLEFMVPLAGDATRGARRAAIEPIRAAVAGVHERVDVFKVAVQLDGVNLSTQCNGAVEYQSPTTGESESILIEVSLRELLLRPVKRGAARTLLLDPIDGVAAVPEIEVSCIALEEAMAEKFRAALSRREVAIRDFYDLDHAVRHLGLDPLDVSLVSLVRQKLSVRGTPPVDVGGRRLEELRRQLEARLRPVLRDVEYEAFDLERAISIVMAMATCTAAR